MLGPIMKDCKRAMGGSCAPICLIPRLEKEKILLFVVGLNLFFTTVSVEWLYTAWRKNAELLSALSNDYQR